MSISTKIAFNTSAQLVGKAATTISTIIVTVLITRNFSVSDFGNYTAIISYIALFYVFTDFGLNAIFVRGVGKDGEKQKEYFKNLLSIRIVGSLITAFAATAVIAFTDHPSAVKLGIIAALGILMAQSLVNTALALFQSKVRYDQVLVGDIIGAIANVTFVYIAATSFHQIFFIVVALVIGNILKAAVVLYLAKFQLGTLALKFDLVFWKNFVVSALPVGLIAVFSSFNAQIDKQIVLLASYKPSLGFTGGEAAGIYGLAYTVFGFAIVLPTFVMNVGYPLMVQKKEVGVSSLLKFSKKIGGYLLVLGILGTSVGWLLTPTLLDILGQGKFAESIFTTRLLLLGLPLFFITPVTLWLAITLNKQKEMLFIYAFVATFNLVANLTSVPTFGYNAAAVVTIISELFIFLLTTGVLYIHFRSEIR